MPPDDLARYDDNIRSHLAAMNARRPEPITLRYFQHLAVLYSELFLDWYFNRRAELLRSLNAFVATRNASKTRRRAAGRAVLRRRTCTSSPSGWPPAAARRCIMHLNYRQFLHYNNEPLDNILLITPNEGLSEQHLAEMAASGIPAPALRPERERLGLAGQDTVRVIEITKLVEEKRGGGVSVPVEAFEGNNLIFVDEGHKGSGGEAWRKFRDALGETGFTFEYSATFGQALTAARNDAADGRVRQGHRLRLLLPLLLRRRLRQGLPHPQPEARRPPRTRPRRCCWATCCPSTSSSASSRSRLKRLRPYNLEQPLWVFVGSSVNAVYTEDRQKRSDVLTVVRFLQHVLENRRGWAVKTIKKLLEGKTGLRTPDGSDVFAGKFPYLRELGLSPEAAYEGILSKVLHAPVGGGLHLCDIRGSAGEIGLKASGARTTSA